MTENLARMGKALSGTGAMLALGLALRVWHLLRMPSVWHDEAALVLNALGKSFGELLGPLYFAEAAPPLFLWVERAVSLLFGDGALALRLVPFMASCAALGLVAWTARRLLPPAAATWAVLLFAVSDHVLWHGCEAKPYAVDMLVAALLPALCCALEHWPLRRRLLLYAVLAVPLIFLSYPACFVYGGLLVALLPAVQRDRTAATWLHYGLLALAVFAAFSVLALGPVRSQRHELMDMCWVHQFPPWQQPWRVPDWVICSSLDVGRYCFEPTGHALAIVAGIGAVVLWRRGLRSLVVILLLPLALALLASCLGKYPYGGARVEVYAAPALALLIAAGVPAVWAWLEVRCRYGSLVLVGMLLAPAAVTAYRVVVPWPRADCQGAAAFVLAQRRPEEPVQGNDWCHQYYFRALGQSFQPLGTRTAPENRRLCVVLTAQPRPTQLFGVTDEWQPVAARAFAYTTVFLLEKRARPAR